MSEILNVAYVIVAVLLLFGAAVFVHEFGHFWMARRCGLKVEAFAIGFGPKIFSWTRDGIEYSWRWIPAGGFVKLPQMITSEALEGESGTAGEKIPPAPPLSKILVAVAGPLMNVVFGFAIAALIYLVGLPVAVNPSIIGHVEPGSEEYNKGIREGDQIVMVDGRMAKSWQEVQEITALARTNVLPVVTERNGIRATNYLTATINDTVGLKLLELEPRDHPVVSLVEKESPAEKAGLQERDKFISFGGVPVVGQQQLVDLIRKRGGVPTEVVVERDKKLLTLAVTPRFIDAEKKVGRIGVGLTGDSTVVYRVMKPGPKPWEMIADVWNRTIGVFNALIHSKQTGVGPKDLSGPVGIIAMLAIWVNTDYRLALYFLVLLNVNLAVLNMLPVPVLDGGHVLLSIIEKIRRRPLSARIQEYATTAFAVLLISFMLYVTFFDIRRLPFFKLMFKRDVQIQEIESPSETSKPAPAPAPVISMRYCESPFFHQRRRSREIIIGDPANGGVIVGSDHPVVKQSMLTCDTMDTATCVSQTLELVEAGCQLVRITAPTVKDAANLRNIVVDLRARGCQVPIVADIHFKPEAAMEAAQWVEVVRINPGNYADKKKFAVKEYTDEEYAGELKRIEEQFTPLVRRCKALKRAMRIGTNHGSLSDRIMNRYGDTPLGMVESALEFASICRKHDFHNFKFSMKSSNPKVMIECYRLLAARLEQEGPDWNYPIHLGVTEAGEGEDGRIKSAIGIGSLLCDGLGDTIRVSLTEDSPREIEVCTDLLAQIPSLTVSDGARGPSAVLEGSFPFDPFAFERRHTPEIDLADGVKCGGEQTVRVVVTRTTWDKVAPKIRPKDDVKPEAVYEDLNVLEADPTQDFEVNCDTQLITVKDGLNLPVITAFRLLVARLKRLGRKNPILLKDCLEQNGAGETPALQFPLEPKIALLRASVVIGSLLADGIGDAILVRGEPGAGQGLRLAYNILQAAGCRSFKTDYVACPSCGRTLFNLQTVTGRIKERTQHLKGVKIAIMGCIVNGPGEMADADFGYVGGAPGKINLYVGKTAVKFNIPEVEAVDRLVDLVREHGKWVEPAERLEAVAR